MGVDQPSLSERAVAQAKVERRADDEHDVRRRERARASMLEEEGMPRAK